MNLHCILLSGGTGERMAAGKPKQFIELLGIPVLRWSALTLSNFSKRRLTVVAPANLLAETRSMLEGIESVVVPGGSTRHDSTLCGIRSIAKEIHLQSDIVLIHDAARPVIRHAELSRLCDLFKDETILCSSLVGPIVETIVQSRDGKTSDGIADRDQLRAVKTPQALRANALRALLEVEGNFTDLLSWAHATGLKAGLALAEETNVKLTSQGDLDLMLSLLNRLKIDGPS